MGKTISESEAETSSSVGQESAHVHKLCYDACRMLARGVTQNTARSRCKEMPGSFPLPMWYYLREPTAPSTTSLLSEQWQPSTQRLPVEDLAIKSPPNAIHSFGIVRLDEEISGRYWRLQGVALAHFDTNSSGTYLENMLSSTTNESGRKAPRTKSKPSLINDQVEMDE